MKSKCITANWRIVIGLFFLAVLSGCIRPEKADLIIHNAVIYSVDDNFTVYEAMAVSDGKIIELGKENQILNKYSATEKIDAQKGIIYPGFIDAHCHFLGYGLSLQQVDLVGAQSMTEMVDRCKKFVTEGKAQNEWIVGRGWDNHLWDNQEFPTFNELNEAFPDRPVLLRRVDGHGALANLKALQLADITSETLINGGHIEVLDGQLTGMLMDNAVDLVLSKIPSAGETEKRQAVLDAQKKCFEYGLTTVTDAGLEKSDVVLLEKLEKAGDLMMNIYVMLSDNEVNYRYFVDTIGKPYATERLHIGGFKFYSDGSLGSKSACLKRPYYDSSSTVFNYGFLLKDQAYFYEKAKLMYDRGFQMCTHAIGDSAVKIILDTYAKVLLETNDRRWRIEHAQVVDSFDFDKFRTYSIIPSVQPTHATSDMLWAVKLLGNRSKNSYAYKQLLSQNGLIALGTDFPIERISPIETFYAAVARKNLKGYPKNGFQIENALSRTEALKGMTIWAALANFEEKEKGSLEVGKRADFVILSTDLLQCEEDDILKTTIHSTYISGKRVY
jgi:predicted amidohydrolase YtcJ